MLIRGYDKKDKEKIESLIWDDDFVKKDLLGCLEEWPHCAIVSEENEEIISVGVFTGISEETSFILYVEPKNRGKGIGNEILKALEKKMIEVGILKTISDFKVNDRTAKFMYSNGYRKSFESNFMIYKGGNREFGDYEIIQYEDKYYEVNSSIYNEAFYNMRVLVGIEEGNCGSEEKIELSEEEKTAINRRRKEVYNNRENIYLLRDNERIVGSITLSNDEIDAIAVDINSQGKGYGKALIGFGVNKLLERKQENINLWCVEGNPAKYLYEKCDFEILRVHEFVKKTF